MPMRDENPCKNISASLLMENFERFSEQYGSDYPVVRNPEALVKGIDSVVHAMNQGFAPKNILLYVLEDEQDKKNPYGARYILAITRVEDELASLPSFAIRLFFNESQEMESISTVEPGEVVWSPDDLSNSQHLTRTKYYLGFTYMLCDKSPGFDQEALAEEELTLEEFLKYGVEGEIPAELIDVSVDIEAAEGEKVAEGADPISQANAQLAEDALEMFGGADAAAEVAVAEGFEGVEEVEIEILEEGGDAADGIDDDAAGAAESEARADAKADIPDEPAAEFVKGKEEKEGDFDESAFEREISNLFDDAMFSGEGQTELVEVSESDLAGFGEDEDASAEEPKKEPKNPEVEVPEEDDTEVVIISPEEYEEEYDDLETDYEELFEG